MSALNSNNTFDGLDEPVRPTPGGRKRRQRKSQKTTKKKVRHSGGALIYPLWDVNVTDVYASKGGV